MMLWTRTIDDQCREAANDPLRVLIIGAGMAGLTLAQLLRKRGLHPVLVDRAGADADRGYMLALLPLVDPLLRELDLTEAYVQRSQPIEHYRIRGRHGGPISQYGMSSMLGAFGDYRGISRANLLQTLSLEGGGITYGATVTGIRRHSDRVEVEISETPAKTPAARAEQSADRSTDQVGGAGAHQAVFDLMVVADGLHSATRDLVLDPGEVEVFDAGWGGWVVWMDQDEEPDLGEELWGNDVFVGSYPVLGKIGVFIGGPRDRTTVGAERFIAGARERIGLPVGSENSQRYTRLDRGLRAVAEADESYFWPMVDRRAPRWVFDRVLLLGDAAAGFLPTAGIGAGMAMESAWVLAHHLDRADASTVASILQEYEQAQRPRVEAAQTNSRNLSKIMFRGGAALSAVRDLATRVMPIEAALKPIRTLLEQRPTVGSRG